MRGQELGARQVGERVRGGGGEPPSGQVLECRQLERPQCAHQAQGAASSHGRVAPEVAGGEQSVEERDGSGRVARFGKGVLQRGSEQLKGTHQPTSTSTETAPPSLARLPRNTVLRKLNAGQSKWVGLGVWWRRTMTAPPLLLDAPLCCGRVRDRVKALLVAPQRSS